MVDNRLALRRWTALWIALSRKRARLCTVLALAFVLTGCADLPRIAERPATHAMLGPTGTPLRDVTDRWTGTHHNLSGFYALDSGVEAFVARESLIDAATRSLDVQYYLWHDDVTGDLLLDALRRAADRGVRVRLLLDGNNSHDIDAALRGLAANANVEVRIFNAFAPGVSRLVAYVTDFSRVNRRMHNKSLTADGVVTIIGGRNIGDEYFDAAEAVDFVDLDVIAVGPAVAEVSKSFDEFWNSEAAFPVAGIIGATQPADLERVRTLRQRALTDASSLKYINAMVDSPLAPALISGDLAMEWAEARVVADHPSKVSRGVSRHTPMIGRLESAIGRPIESELDIVSPYFVPGRRGIEMLRDLTRRGVKVRILTNALESTAVPIVHSGYAKHRQALLDIGAELYEMKRSATARRPVGALRRGSSGASLHAKSFAIDRRLVFVGSFNVDPRSASLNTEIGVVIASDHLAAGLSDAFDTVVPAAAYRVRRNAKGELEWVESRNGSEVVHRHEPGVGILKRFWVDLMSLLPIEPLL